MSETSSGSVDRMQCLSIILQRTVGINKYQTKELANTLSDEEVINKDQKKALMNVIKKKQLLPAIDQMIEYVRSSEYGIKKFPEYLKEIDDTSDLVIALVEKVVADQPSTTLVKIIQRWDSLVAREGELKNGLPAQWPKEAENLKMEWPIKFILFCAEEATQAEASKLLSGDSSESPRQMTTGESDGSDLTDTGLGGTGAHFTEEPLSLGTESDFEVIQEDEVDQLDKRPGESLKIKSPDQDAVDMTTDDSLYQENSNPDEDKGFLLEHFEEIKESIDVLLPFVQLIWPGEPEVKDEDNWPEDLIDIASMEVNEQLRDQLIKICQYVFQRTKNVSDFQPETQLDTGATEQWIQNLDKYFDGSDEQVEAMKMLLEITWPELVNDQPNMWRGIFIQKFQYEPSRATDFVNAANMLLGLIKKDLDKPIGSCEETSTEESTEIDWDAIAEILSGKESQDATEFLTENYDELSELRDLLFPMLKLLWPETSELMDEKAWLDNLIGEAVGTENQEPFQKFIKHCQCLMNVKKASSKPKTNLIVEPKNAWKHAEDVIPQFMISEISLAMLNLLLKSTWPNLENIQPNEWNVTLQIQYEEDQQKFTNFINASKICLDLYQFNKLEKATGDIERSTEPASGADTSAISTILMENYDTTDPIDFLNDEYDELLRLTPLILPILQLIWSDDSGLMDEKFWIDELITKASDNEGLHQYQQFVKICHCLMELGKTCPKFEHFPVVETQDAWHWIEKAFPKYLESKLSFSILNLLLKNAWKDFVSIQPNTWKKTLQKLCSSNQEKFIYFVNAAKLFLGLLEINLQRRSSEDTSTPVMTASLDRGIIAKILSGDVELDEPTNFFTEKYDEIGELRSLLLPLIQLIWPDDSELLSEESWQDELINRADESETAPSIQQFQKLCHCLIELPKASNMTVPKKMNSREARTWAEDVAPQLLESELNISVISFLMKVVSPNSQRIQSGTWIETMKGLFKENQKRFTDFINATKIFVDLFQDCKPKEPCDHQDSSKEEIYLKENFGAITAAGGLLMPIVKLVWPYHARLTEKENWPDELISVISKADDRLPGQHFIQACQCVMDLRKDNTAYQLPQTMDAKTARGWILTVSNDLSCLEENIAAIDMLFQLAWPNVRRLDVRKWTQTLLRQYKLDMTTTINFANAVRIILGLSKDSREKASEGKTKQQAEGLNQHLNYFHENYKEISDSENLLIPIVKLIWPSESVEFREDGWPEDFISMIANLTEKPLVQDFIEICRNILDMTKKMPDSELANEYNLNANQLRAWIINCPRMFRKTKEMENMFIKLLDIAWPDRDSIKLLDWTKNLLQAHKEEVKRTAEFANAANVFLQLHKIRQTPEILQAMDMKEFQDLALFFNDRYEDITHFHKVLQPFSQLAWPRFAKISTAENWPDDLIGMIFEKKEIVGAEAFIQLCDHVLQLLKSDPEFEPSKEQLQTNTRKLIVEVCKKFKTTNELKNLFNSLLKLSWPNFGEISSSSWLKQLLQKLNEEKDQTINFITSALILLELLEINKTAGGIKTETENKSSDQVKTEEQELSKPNDQTKPQENDPRKKKKKSNEKDESASQKLNDVRNEDSNETKQNAGAETMKPAEGPKVPTTQQKETTIGSGHGVSSPPFTRSRNQGRIPISEVSPTPPPRRQRSKALTPGVSEWVLRRSQPPSKAMETRQKQIHDGGIIIRVAVSGVHDHEEICIEFNKKVGCWKMEQLEVGIFCITIPWQNEDLIYLYKKFNKRTHTYSTEMIPAEWRIVYPAHNSESYICDAAFFHTADQFSLDLWSGVMLNHLPKPGNDLFTSDNLKSEILGWTNQMKYGWTFYGNFTKYVCSQQEYEKVLIDWLQSLQKQEKILGTLAMLYAMGLLKSGVSEELRNCVLECLHVHTLQPDDQRELHRDITNLFISKKNSDIVARLILGMLQKYYIEDWILSLPLYHLLTNSTFSKERNDWEKSALLANRESRTIMAGIMGDWKIVQKACSASKYQECLINIALIIEELSNNYPWICYIYQCLLNPQSLIKLMLNKVQVVRSFQLDLVLQVVMKHVEQLYKSSNDPEACEISTVTEELFQEIFEWAWKERLDEKFTENDTANCINILIKMIPTLSSSLKRFKYLNKRHIIFCSKITSLIADWAEKLVEAQTKFTDATSRSVSDLINDISQKIKFCDPKKKSHLQFFDKLLGIKWHERYCSQWVEIIQAEISLLVDQKWKNDEEYLKFYTRTLLEINFSETLEHCYLDKALSSAERVLGEDEAVNTWFCGFFSTSKNRSLLKFFDKLFLKEAARRKITAEVSTKEILKFICEWKISVDFFRSVYRNSDLKAVESLPDSKDIIKMIEQRIRKFSQDLNERKVLRDELAVIREYHDKICAFIRVLYSKTIGTGIDSSLEQILKIMQAKCDQFKQEYQNYRTFGYLCEQIEGATQLRVNISKLKSLYERAISSQKVEDLFTIKDVEASPSKYMGLTSDFMKRFYLIYCAKESITFQNLWKKVCKNYEDSDGIAHELDWKDVLSFIWEDVEQELCSMATSIQKESLSFGAVIEVFKWSEGDITRIEKELEILYRFCENQNESNDTALNLQDAASRISQAFEIKRNSMSLKWVADFIKLQNLVGDFEQLDKIPNTEDTDITLKDIDENLLTRFPIQLHNMTASQLDILQKFIEQDGLIKWIQSTKMTDVSEVKVMCNLAMSSAGETPLETDRVLHLLHATQGFAPLLFHLKELTSIDLLLEQCKEVWKNVEENKNIMTRWESSGNHLQWFKERESLVGSDQKQSLALAQSINERGVYTIGKITQERITFENCVSLTLQNKESTPQKGKKLEKYNLNSLQDLQSKLALIAGEEDKGQQDIAQFVDLFTAVKTLAEAFVNLTDAGCMLFNEWTAMISSNTYADTRDRQHEHNLTIKIHFMKESTPLSGTASLSVLQELSKTLRLSYNQWKDYINSKRLEHYHLNEYNIQQITYLCNQLATVKNTALLPDQALALLSNNSKSITSGSIHEALDHAIKIEDNEEEDEDITDVSGHENKEEGMTEMEKKKRTIRILVNRERMTEDLAKAAIQAVGHDDIDECNNWVLLHQYDEDEVQRYLSEFNEDRENAHQSNEEEEILLDNKSMRSLTQMIDQIIETTHVNDGAELKIVGAVKTICNRYYEKTKVLTMQDYLSVEHLGKFLTNLHEKHGIKQSAVRDIELPMEQGRPNLVMCQEEESIPTLLSLYMRNPEQPLPTTSEVLLCSEQTTIDEVERFLRRALCKCKSNGQPLFCMSSTEKLKPKVSKSVQEIYDDLLQRTKYFNKEFQLVILSSNPQHSISECFEKHQVQLPLPKKESFETDIIKYLKEHLSTDSNDVGPSIVKTVESSRSGVGKSLYIKNLSGKLDKRWYEKTKQIEHMEAFLSILNRNAKNDLPIRNLPTPMQTGKVNVICCPETAILPALISLYMTDPKQPLPTASEVLLCCQQTGEEEIARFMRRAMCKSKQQGKRLYAIAYGERLKPEVARKIQQLSESLSTNIHADKKYQLALLTSDVANFNWDREQSESSSTCLFKVTENSQHNCSEKISLYLNRKNIGKCEPVKLMAVARTSLPRYDVHSVIGESPDIWHKTTIRLLEENISNNHVLDRLYRKKHFRNEDNHFIHLDLTPAVKNGIEQFMFNLLILGSIQDTQGRIWNRQKQHFYVIEMTRSELNKKQIPKNSILNLLPSMTCLSPMESLGKIKTVRTKTVKAMKEHLPTPKPGEAGYQELKKAHEFINDNSVYLLEDFQYDERDTSSNTYMMELLRHSGFPNAVTQHISEAIPDDRAEHFRKIFEEENLQNIVLMNYEEFISSTFQRPYQYLKHATIKDINLDDFQYSQPQGNQEDCIKILLNNYVSENPTWAQLRHFASFMNVQLKNCEECIFCQKVDTGKKWQDTELRGLKDFAVKFMIRMSQDFATPSLEIADESSKDVAENLEKHQFRRKWEGKCHPYLFFNEDRTMTFINVALNSNGDLLDEKGDIVETGIASRSLMRGLAAQQVKFDFNFHKKSREEKLNTLRTIMGLPASNSEPDLTYELTTDNVLKILAIYMRLKCNIPVIVMGETGCGKTRMVEFMSKLRAGEDRNARNMVTLKIHGGVTSADIYASVKKANKIAKENAYRNISTVLFYDEANTTTAIHAIKEVVCDNTVNGISFSDCKLQIVAACNPHKSLSKKAIENLENSGLGYRVSASETTNCFGKIPIRRLVYKVVPLPPSMQPFVWDFGQLSMEAEEKYIHQMTKHLADTLGLNDNDKKLIDYILCSAQFYMKSEMKDECRYVSLRDVERSLKFFQFFYDQQVYLFPRIKNKLNNHPDISPTLRCLIQTIGICYHVSLENRSKFRKYIETCLSTKKNFIMEKLTEKQINEELIACQNVFLGSVTMGKNIAPNEALRENVYLITICCELRIPLFLVGKPGSSKSLAKTIVAENMEGKTSKTQLYKRLKQIHMVSYQCSALTDASGIEEIFKQCSELQKDRIKHDDKNLDSFSAVVVLDEIGLAEDSPNMPLKVLHPLLECGSTESGTIADTKPNDKVGFVGISNWALDPAKMNRGIFVTRTTPNEKDLLKTATDIMTKSNRMMDEETDVLKKLTEAYLNIYKRQKYMQVSKEYFGLRDYYSLIKMINAKSEGKEKCDYKDIAYAVQRNFSGGHEDTHFQTLTEAVKMYYDGGDAEKKSVKDMIKDNLAENDSRFLLLLTNQHSSVPLLEYLIEDFHNKVQVIYGSSFPGDHSYTEICKNINRIKVCMEAGRTVVLLDMEEVHESLYEALNQHYMICGGQRYVEIGLGGHRVKCRIADNFRLIVMEQKENVYQNYAIPLVNRLEKHHLESSNLLNDSQLKESKGLKIWCKEFANAGKFNENDAFIGYHSNTASSVVLVKGKRRNRELCKQVLLQSVATDAIFRTAVPEKTKLLKTYTENQFHDNLVNLLAHILERNKDLSVMEITSFSNILTDKDKEKIAASLSLKQKSIMLLSLQLFDSQQEYLSKLEAFFKKSSESKKILLIQCPQAHRHMALIECAKYGLMNMLKDVKEQIRNTQFIVAFLLSTQRQHTSHSENQPHLVLQHSQAFEIIYVDDLRPPSAGKIIVSQFYGKSFSDILAIGEQEIKEGNHENQIINFLGLLKDSICQAITKIRRDKRTNHRNLQSIECITALCKRKHELSDRFLNSLTSCMQNIYKQHDSDPGIITDQTRSWIVKEAMSAENLQEGGTFGKTLSLAVKRYIADLLAFIISSVDENNNLDFLFNSDQDQWKKDVWLEFFKNLEQEWSKMKGRHEFDVRLENHLTEKFSPKFPFSYALNKMFGEHWSSVADEGPKNRKQMFIKSVHDRPEILIIAKACENHEKEVVLSYAADALKCNSYFGNLDELPQEKLIDILLIIFERQKIDMELFENGDQATLVYYCLQEYLQQLCMICEIFKIRPDVSDNTGKWIEQQQNCEDFIIHELAVESIFEWIGNYNIHDDESCIKWMTLTRRCKKVYHRYKNLFNNRELKKNIESKWEPISLLDLLLLHLLPNADDELFQRYVSVIVTHAKRLLKPLQKYGSRAQNFLKILSNVLRKSYEDIELKLLVAWKDLTCRMCRKVLSKKPVILPCNHFVCKNCIDTMLVATEMGRQCPQCPNSIPEDFRAEQAELTQKQKSLLKKFQENCTSFFLEYMSQFCFPGQEHDVTKQAELFLYELVVGIPRNNDRMELETVALDLNIATKSRIFQLLMQNNSDLLQIEINKFLSNNDKTLTYEQLGKLVTVILSAFETNAVEEDWKSLQSIWCRIQHSESITLQCLGDLAKLRRNMHVYIGRTRIKGREALSPEVYSLIDMCVNDETETLRTFAVKSGCGMFGTEWFDFICRHTRLRELVPKELGTAMQGNLIDYWLILGKEYSKMRENLHRLSHKDFLDQLKTMFPEKEDIKDMLPRILAVINFANAECTRSLEEHVKLSNPAMNHLFVAARQLSKQISGSSIKQTDVLKQLAILTVTLVICQPLLLKNFAQLCIEPKSMEKSFWPGMPVSMFFAIKDALQSETEIAQYICPNGHPYVIGECTRPYYEAKCPTCGATIGGRFHRAAEGNTKIEQSEASQAGYQLNSDTAGKDDPSDRMSKQGVALVHFITHCCMLFGLDNNAETICRMLHINTCDISRKYLCNKLQENINDFAKAMGRNMDDAIMIIHKCLKTILHTESEDKNDVDWNTTNNRCFWETEFRELYLLPVFQNIDAALDDAHQNINAVENLEDILLYRILNEIETEEQPTKLIWNHPILWKTIKHSNAAHLMQYVRDSASTGPVLKIILESPDLHLLQHMENVLAVQKTFLAEYQYQIDMKQAEEKTFSDFMDDPVGFKQKSAIQSYIDFWNSIYEVFRQHPDKKIKQYLVEIDHLSSISMALPSTRGRGKCAKILAEYLIDTHNNFLEKCFSVSKMTNGHGDVEVSRLGSNFIHIDKEKDLLPLIRMHTSYTITEDKFGSHHKITYNIDALEKQVREKYVTYQHRIDKKSLPCMKYPQDVGVGTDWDKVSENIPQIPLTNKLAQEVDNLVTNQDTTPADVCEGVRTLTHAISFLAKIKVDGSKPLQRYMEENLLLSPSHMAMIPKSSHTCHTLALYQRLMWHKAVNFVQQGLDPYQALYEVKQEEIKDMDVLRRLKDAFDHTDMNLFQQRLNEMLIKVPDFTPEWSLKDMVFPYLEFIEENTPAWYERIPGEICFMHISHLFRLAVKGIELPEDHVQ